MLHAPREFKIGVGSCKLKDFDGDLVNRFSSFLIRSVRIENPQITQIDADFFAAWVMTEW